MQNQLRLILILAAVTAAFALARPFMSAGAPLTVSGTYRAFAHLFVGFLFGMWFCDRQNRYPLILALILTAIEAGVAIWVRVL